MLPEEKKELLAELDKSMNKVMLTFEKDFLKTGFDLTCHYVFEVEVRHFPDGENGCEDKDGMLVVRKKMEG